MQEEYIIVLCIWAYIHTLIYSTKKPEYLEIDRIYNIYILGSECILYSFNLERNQTSRRVNQKDLHKQQKKYILVYASFSAWILIF